VLEFLQNQQLESLWTLGGEGDQAAEHPAGKRHELQAWDRFRQPFEVPNLPPEAACPGELSLVLPPARQRHKAPLGLGQLDDLRGDAARRGRVGRRLARVPLTDEGKG
jgi:hypothetical protein